MAEWEHPPAVLRFLPMWMKRLFSTIAFLIASASGASAQPPAPPSNTEQKCTPSEAKAASGTIVSPKDTTGQHGDRLGDKLAESDGIICPPPNVDPKMRAPAPSGGPMPVIPPPGSPGGDQTVRPK
jgi:hypothetical protein